VVGSWQYFILLFGSVPYFPVLSFWTVKLSALGLAKLKLGSILGASSIVAGRHLYCLVFV